MTKDEAYIEVAGKNTSLGFCPLLDGPCNPRCVCYSEAKVRKRYQKENEFDVYGPYCTNYSIVGSD